jgi:hypothetical protein
MHEAIGVAVGRGICVVVLQAIAINQDALASPAFRIVGDDLAFPCGAPDGVLAEVVAVTCDASDTKQQWTWDASRVSV